MWRVLHVVSLMCVVGLLAVAVDASAASGSCATDLDCGLLGRCERGVGCRCFPGYTGDTCAELDLVPAPPNAGLRQQGNRSNWCGTILQDPTKPDLWHMYNSDFADCGLGIWLTGSRVIHTISRGSPLGPYTPTGEVAVAGEAHNPQAIRAPDGTYLLMDSYNGPDAGCRTYMNYTTCTPDGCTSGHGGNCSCAPNMPHRGVDGGPGNFTYHISKSAAGPWAPITVQMEYPCWGLNLTPSPAFHPNGTMFIAFHCDDAMGDVVMVSAPTYAGPFTAVHTRIGCQSAPPVGFGIAPHPEDPFLWIADNDGAISFHVVVHDLPHGVHFFSTDGISWHLHQQLDHGDQGQPLPPFFFSNVIEYTDGTTATVTRRERPWMLFNTDGSPRALVTSMKGGNHPSDSSVWTMVQATSAPQRPH